MNKLTALFLSDLKAWFVVVPALLLMLGNRVYQWLPGKEEDMQSITITLSSVEVTFLISVCISVLIVVLPGWYLKQTFRSNNKQRNPKDMIHQHTTNYNIKHTISTLQQLRKAIPAGLSGANFTEAKKVIDHLDDQMVGFIQHSPFLQLSTLDENGYPFISPKGDVPGFVTVHSNLVENSVSSSSNSNSSTSSSSMTRRSTLIIPDRPGNRLIFGLQNILLHPQVSILFVIPGTSTTLRCGGIAYISQDPSLLQPPNTNKPNSCKVVIVVEVQWAFFHCAKAYIRSRLWEPDTWNEEEYKVGFGRYFAAKESKLAQTIDEDVDKHYETIKMATLGQEDAKDNFD